MISNDASVQAAVLVMKPLNKMPKLKPIFTYQSAKTSFQTSLGKWCSLYKAMNKVQTDTQITIFCKHTLPLTVATLSTSTSTVQQWQRQHKQHKHSTSKHNHNTDIRTKSVQGFHFTFKPQKHFLFHQDIVSWHGEGRQPLVDQQAL